jgi:hypothetical protein
VPISYGTETVKMALQAESLGEVEVLSTLHNASFMKKKNAGIKIIQGYAKTF